MDHCGLQVKNMDKAIKFYIEKPPPLLVFSTTAGKIGYY